MRLSIFTPTYNRAYCLDRLFRSLERQSKKDFKWLIIDDGSTDNTEELVSSFISEASFPITYIKQANSGKHVAYNRAVDLCDTELFFCVDSDDYLTDTAVEKILKVNAEKENESLLGFYFKRVLPNGENMTMPFPTNIENVGITDLYHKYQFTGDTAIVLRTKFIKGLHFPIFAPEKFVSERVIYNKYNYIAPMMIVDQGIYISEYLDDGYTKNGIMLRARNPYGTALDYLSESIYAYKVFEKVKYYSQFLSFCKVFSLDKSNFDGYEKPYVYIRIIGRLLMPHYNKLFDIQKRLLKN